MMSVAHLNIRFHILSYNLWQLRGYEQLPTGLEYGLMDISVPIRVIEEELIEQFRELSVPGFTITTS